MSAGPHVVRAVLRDAATRLRVAGVDSPETDARILLAHACGIEPARIPLLDGVDDETVAVFEGLVTSRAARVPLQHLRRSNASGRRGGDHRSSTPAFVCPGGRSMSIGVCRTPCASTKVDTSEG